MKDYSLCELPETMRFFLSVHCWEQKPSSVLLITDLIYQPVNPNQSLPEPMKTRSCNPRRLVISLVLFGLLSSLTANAATAPVDIQNFAFNPQTVTINVGDSVVWTQRDTTTHTVTSDTGAFGSGNLTLSKPKYTNTFNAAGSFNYHCIPHAFMTGTIIVQAAANTPPTVSITSPTNGAVFTSGDSITLNATATDSDGTVAAVEFREGANVLGSVSTSPYSFVWTNVVAGSYTLTADATDNLGAKTNSAPVTITVVTPNAPPLVSITSPTNGEAFTAGTNIIITAVATDSDGTIASVEFHEGTNVLGTVTNSPYSFTWNNVSAGTNTLTAVATDNLGLKTSSDSVAITVVAAPSQPINITTPLATNNAITLTWAGGTGPYLVQMKSTLSDTNWFDVMTTTNQSAIVARVGSHAFFRINDQASATVTPFTVAMNGAAERPAAVTTGASGVGIFSLSGNVLSYLISFAGLSGPATAAHIHGPSTTTNAVGVMVPFAVAAVDSGTIQGTFDVTTLSAEQLAALKTGRTYANIHTAANKNGEIRGQISPVHFSAVLGGGAEVPPVTTAASGTGSFDLIGDQLFYTVIYSGLSAAATASHIHAPIGANGTGPVLIPFTAPSGTSGTISGVASLTPEKFAAFVDAANAGGAYANVHTSANPSGEIRGTLTTP